MQLSHSIQMMGTTIDILIDSDTPKEHIAEVCHLLELYKNRFSANDADSELMVTNDNSSIIKNCIIDNICCISNFV